jgi:hypothetical protein
MLEDDPTYLPGPPGVQSQAQQILRLSFNRNRAVRNAIADWTEHCERVSCHSTSNIYTECTEYDTLLDFGESVIPQVMLQYLQDMETQSAGGSLASGASGIGRGVLFWYELLHEIMWGMKTGLQTVEFGAVFQQWERWFQEEEAESAPREGS